MINPVSIRYHRAADGTVRLRAIHGNARLALVAGGRTPREDGWVSLSQEAGAELQAQGGPAQAHDRQVLVAKADLERWLGKSAPVEAPKRLPALVRIDWAALANEVEALGTGKPRAVIVEVLVRAGMSTRANPEVLAWAVTSGQGAA